MNLTRSSSESSPAGDVVTLDVGGTVFKTRLSTLNNRGPNYFTSLIGAKYATLFVDRNPQVFAHILDHLRGYPNVAETLDIPTRAKFEADVLFYQLK